MRKHNPRRRVRHQSYPGLVLALIKPEEATRLSMAIHALKEGWASEDHFEEILNVVDRLRLIAEHKQDAAAAQVTRIARATLNDIATRHAATAPYAATADEIATLDAMAIVSDDRVNRTSSHVGLRAEQAVAHIRRLEKAAKPIA